MTLETLRCPSCNGELSFEKGTRMTICKYCGNNVIIDINKSDSEEINKFLKLCSTAIKALRLKEAEEYCKKILDIDNQNCDAWFFRGAVSLLNNATQFINSINRDHIKYPTESIVYFDNAINYSKGEERKEIVKNIIEHLTKAGILFHDGPKIVYEYLSKIDPENKEWDYMLNSIRKSDEHISTQKKTNDIQNKIKSKKYEINHSFKIAISNSTIVGLVCSFLYFCYILIAKSSKMDFHTSIFQYILNNIDTIFLFFLIPFTIGVLLALFSKYIKEKKIKEKYGK